MNDDGTVLDMPEHLDDVPDPAPKGVELKLSPTKTLRIQGSELYGLVFVEVVDYEKLGHPVPRLALDAELQGAALEGLGMAILAANAGGQDTVGGASADRVRTIR